MEYESKSPQVEVSESILRVIDQAQKEAEGECRHLEESIAGINKHLPKVPDSVLRAINEVEKMNREWGKRIKAMESSERTILPMVLPEVVAERNEWKRHDALLGILRSLLFEQRSGSMMTKWILGLTVALVVLTVALVIITFIPVVPAVISFLEHIGH